MRKTCTIPRLSLRIDMCPTRPALMAPDIGKPDPTDTGDSVDMLQQIKTVRENCTSFLTHHPARSMTDWYRILLDFVADDAKPDNYGQGDYLNQFEKRIAELLDKPAAVFMPSGTMAQQIALRIWADHSHNYKVALHPTAHLEIAEHYGYQHLHPLQRIQWGIPDMTATRVIKATDVTNLKERPGTILLELPIRPLGGQLPTWNDLEEIRAWCDDHDVRLHLDGARLWEAGPYYMKHNDKSLADIAALFDSIYVSFYKGLDGIAGCMLLGPSDFIDEAKIWQRRLGGNLRSQFPLYTAAQWGLDRNLLQMTDYYHRSVELAEYLNSFDIFETVPIQPQTNMFRLYIRATSDVITRANLELAKQSRIWLINAVSPALQSNYCWTEIVIASNSNDWKMDDIKQSFATLVSTINSATNSSH